eukprot:maker-scaffold658_size117954-snap-gene-0.44 protein:Tk06744 transcript:maker-scaffold658_size117954-snap-gene-0.44-mRNA-1 annotation:"protein dpy-30-like protein"
MLESYVLISPTCQFDKGGVEPFENVESEKFGNDQTLVSKDELVIDGLITLITLLHNMDPGDSSGPTSKKAKMSADVKGMSSKEYMDEFVVPVMLKALSAVNKERPDDPIDFLIGYLNRQKANAGSPIATTPTPGLRESHPDPSTPPNSSLG